MKINKLLFSKIGAFFIILPFIKPASEITGRFDILFDLLKLMAIGLIVIEYFVLLRTKWIFHMSFLVVCMQLTFVVSTLIHHGDIKTAIVDAVSNIGICWYMEILLAKDYRIAIRNFAISCSIVAFIVATSMYLFYPHGMYLASGSWDNYMWGFDNTSAFRFLPTMYFCSLYAIDRNKKSLYYLTSFFLLYCTAAFIYVRSLTAGLFFLLFSAVFIYSVFLKKGIKLLNVRNAIIFAITVGLIILIRKNDLTVIMNFAKRSNKFGSISLRFNIWRRAIGEWKNNPILGLGVEFPEKTYLKLLLDHPHNIFLDVLYHGGIVALWFLAGILLRLFMSKQFYTKVNMITAAAVLSILAIAQMDYYNSQYLLYPLLILAWHANRISGRMRYRRR